MELTPGLEWPPKPAARVMRDLAAWSAWYTGDPETLDRHYRTASTTIRETSGGWRKFWWGRPRSTTYTTTRTNALHLPIAADLAATSADLLYSDPPVLTHDDTEINARLSSYAEQGLFDTVMAGAEVGAALGGRYHRVVWDHDTHPYGPFITTVGADHAYPTFRWGRLTDVSFVTEVHRTDWQVWRHVEHHFMIDGYGHIRHTLYEGTPENLGRPVPVTDRPETAGLADVIDKDGLVIQARPSPGLFVEYAANLTPQRRWRGDQFGQHLGRSDYDGIEGFMDAADEVWNSLVREFRLGKARLIVAEHMLETSSGEPAFNLEREAFTAVNALQRPDGQLPITQVQFAIRVQEHLQALDRLTATIIHNAGYSASTFTEHAGDADITATEVRAREKRTLTRRDRKISKEAPALRRLLEKMLWVDANEFSTRVNPGQLVETPVGVEFPAGVQETPLELAKTAQALRVARAASTATIVQHTHPAWTSEEVEAEAARILTEDAGVIDAAATYPHGSYTLTDAALKARNAD